ncbi:LamG domain-containing protein, partial [bacterium]|nr:LamG domain-containing protein [bacterium]
SVSSDYYGPFCTAFARLIGAEKLDPPFVAIMSHGTSGDQQWMDYGRPRKSWGSREKYAELVARRALDAYKTIQYDDRATLRMAERKLTLNRRVPDAKRLAWAKGMMAEMGNRKPRNRPEVYAREALFLHNKPTAELKLQAIRIGGLGITAIPNEVYALTGLKIKAQSPLRPTFNIELANGSEGYIPPPALHPLGGYNTWPARSAGLEVQAEPKITETVLGLLEEVSARPRRKPITPHGAYAKAVLASKPLAYWRMGEFDGPRATDASRHSHHGTYEEGVVFYLEGPESSQFCGEGRSNRAAHFAGGRMKASLKGLATTYSVELWFWNGFPANARAVTGYLFSRGHDGDTTCPGDHLGIGGKTSEPGKLFFFNGNALNEAAEGATPVSFKAWNHVVLVRDGVKVVVYLNGSRAAEIATEVTPTCPKGCNEVFVGGRCDNVCNFEGKIDEVAIYGRALSADEVSSHYADAGVPARSRLL